MNARCDELCRAINEAAAAAADYWSKDGPPGARELKLAEAKILGLQALIDGLYSEVRPRLSTAEAPHIDGLLSQLVDQLSGGQFSVSGRPADAGRTAGVLQCASVSIVAIRHAYYLSMPYAGLATRVRENRNRQLDLPGSMEVLPASEPYEGQALERDATEGALLDRSQQPLND